MADHLWGDKWEHWETLGDAQRWIADTFYESTGRLLSLKEKYGTIRYEFINDLDGDDYNKLWTHLGDIIKQATLKWPEIKEEIEEDYFDN